METTTTSTMETFQLDTFILTFFKNALLITAIGFLVMSHDPNVNWLITHGSTGKLGNQCARLKNISIFCNYILNKFHCQLFFNIFSYLKWPCEVIILNASRCGTYCSPNPWQTLIFWEKIADDFHSSTVVPMTCGEDWMSIYTFVLIDHVGFFWRSHFVYR